MSVEDGERPELDTELAKQTLDDERLFCVQLRAGNLAVGRLSDEQREPLVTHIHDCPWGILHESVPGLNIYGPDIVTRL